MTRDIQTHPDLTGFAPPDCAWSAIDAATYDGASTHFGKIGHGRTEAEAIADLLEQLDE